MAISPPSLRARLQPYLPRLTLEWLASDPDARHRAVDGSVVFVDISGFTALSEKLAKLGKVGAEEMAVAINTCFAELLRVAYEGDGSLLKFGGDALLLLFSGGEPADHAARAARAAAAMRKALRTVGKLETPGGKVNLRMSVGAHTGRFDFFLVGESHRELIVTGPAASEVVRMEGTAEAGEVVISGAMASYLPQGCLGDPKGSGFLLRTAPAGESTSPVWILPEVPDDLLELSVPRATRETLLAALGEPEHRQASIAFIHFEGTDDMLRSMGPERSAHELDRLVRDTQAAVDHFELGFLGSDVDADGGKLILAAGVPRAVGEDEERMLLALRQIEEGDRSIAIRIGVNQGPVFSGDIGPSYRRTYTVMGDTVNLAARLMAKAPVGEIYASGSILERSATRFETVELAPFSVKGKARPVHAWSVGVAIGRPKHTAAEEFPLLGRDDEVSKMLDAMRLARQGERRTVILRGEEGLGKTRLLDELLKEGADLALAGATGETFTSTTPYVAWRDILRELIDVGWESAGDVVIARLRELVLERDPSLLPWLPLIATAADAEAEVTPEVAALDSEFMRPRLNRAVTDFVRAIRTEPTLFVFEDAHHMDEASADLLTAICTDERTDRPWLIVALRRPGGGFDPPPDPSMTIVDLEPIGSRELTALAQIVTDDAPMPGHVVDEVVGRSGGNPQLLLDLIHAARMGDGSLPESVEAAATVRIDGLTPHDRLLVRRVSVFGLAFHPRFLEDVLEGQGPQPDQATWDRLADFFEPEGDGYLRFRRAVIRDAAYDGLPFRIRQRLHLAVGLHFEQAFPDPEDNAGLLSLHFSLGGDHVRAWRYAQIAGRRAASVFANIEAAELHRRAVESGRRLPDVSRAELGAEYEEIGRLFKEAGEFRRSTEAYGKAFGLVAGDTLGQARILLERSYLEDKLGRYRQALAWSTRALTKLEGLSGMDASGLRAETLSWYAQILQSEGRTSDARRWCERAMVEAQRSNQQRAAARAHFVLGWGEMVMGRPAEGHLGEALRIYEEIGYLPGQGQMLQNLGASAYFESRWADAVDLWQRGRDIFVRIGDPATAAVSASNIGEVLIDQGKLAEAEAWLAEPIRVFRAAGDRYAVGLGLSQQGRLLARLGRFDEALGLFDIARAELVDLGAPLDAVEVDAKVAECRVLMGQPEPAIEIADDALARLGSSDGGSAATPSLQRARGYAFAQMGDLEAAWDAFEASLEEARSRGSDYEAALSVQALARLERLTGKELPPALVQASTETLGRLDIVSVPAPLLSPSPART